MVSQGADRGEISRLALETWESLFRAQTTRYREFQASEAWAGRSDRDYDVLYTLSQVEAGMRQKDLTDCLLISQPSLSRLIDRLVAEGVVDRRADPTDRRGAILSLTESGRQLQRKLGTSHARDVTRALALRLTPEEMSTLRDLSRKLLAPLPDHPSPKEGSSS